MKTITTILIILCPFFLFGQEKIPIHWLKDEIKTKVQVYGGVDKLYADGKLLKLILAGEKLDKVLVIDTETEKIEVREFEVDYPERNINFSGVLEFKDRKYAIFTQIDRLEHRYKIYRLALAGQNENKVSLMYEHEFTSFGFSDGILTQARDKYLHKLDAMEVFKFSNDKSKLVFLNQRSYSPKGNKDRIQIAVFNADLKLLWEKSINLPYRDKDCTVGKVVVTNDGKHVFLMSRVQVNNKYISNFYHITPKKVKEIVVKLKEDYTVMEIYPALDMDDNNLIISGLYRSLEPKKSFFSKLSRSLNGGHFGRRTIVAGTFFGKVSLSSIESPQFFYTSFDEEKIEQVKFKTLDALDIHQFQNGNTHILFSVKYRPRENHQKNGSSHLTTFYFDEMLSCTFSSDGDLINSITIDRKIIKEADGKGYAIVYDSDASYILFDTALTKELSERLHVPAKRYYARLLTELVKIDNEGKIQKDITLLYPKKNDKHPDQFEAVQGQIIGDRLYFGGKLLPGGLSFLLGKIKPFRFGYIEMKDLRE